MGLNDIELKKTAILFFDILNGYYHKADPAVKARMKPMVENAVRLMKAGREAKILIFAGSAGSDFYDDSAEKPPFTLRRSSGRTGRWLITLTIFRSC